MSSDSTKEGTRIPRDPENDYTREAADARRKFARDLTGVALEHVSKYSLDPKALPGNIENFTGVAQVPIGLAGPLLVNGEHARGEFIVPLATTEGTLVASFNRGMRLIYEAGGVKTTVLEEQMQRAPAFVFKDALESREFGHWIEENFDKIKATADATTKTGRLTGISQHAIGPTRHLRFHFKTGDAAGQNMVSKATFIACLWIRSNHPGHPEFYMSGNMDTDKKHSLLNMISTRGKRVVAEIVFDKDLLKQHIGVTPQQLFRVRQVQNTGSLLAGASNNGGHAANALAALFIATGQDAGSVSESQAGVLYTQLTDEGHYYVSMTLTSLIVASYGGGTGLPTQRECLELLGCYGEGKANKLAEICAAVVLAGDISLAGASLAGDWVTSHEKMGRNRP
jgi:hydroxymethylglutaryl-CoA reductase (NADPH)